MGDIKLGTSVNVSHPRTCLNPDEFFTIIDVKMNVISKKIWVRGENTCWFNSDMIVKFFNDAGNIEFLRD